jgi:hypothetical protein
MDNNNNTTEAAINVYQAANLTPKQIEYLSEDQRQQVEYLRKTAEGKELVQLIQKFRNLYQLVSKTNRSKNIREILHNDRKNIKRCLIGLGIDACNAVIFAQCGDHSHGWDLETDKGVEGWLTDFSRKSSGTVQSLLNALEKASQEFGITSIHCSEEAEKTSTKRTAEPETKVPAKRTPNQQGLPIDWILYDGLGNEFHQRICRLLDKEDNWEYLSEALWGFGNPKGIDEHKNPTDTLFDIWRGEKHSCGEQLFACDVIVAFGMAKMSGYGKEIEEEAQRYAGESSGLMDVVVNPEQPKEIPPPVVQNVQNDGNQPPSHDKECCICLENPKNMIFLPCGHVCTCQDCAPGLENCPICRGPITGKVKAYF